MIPRLVLLVVVLFGGIGARSTPPFRYAPSLDLPILRGASVALAHRAPSAVLTRLRRNPAVEAAAVGLDGRTVTVRFRDGLQSAILPPRALRPVPNYPEVPRLRRYRALQTGSRAIVLEPFASELGEGGAAGETEASALQSAGFTVDRLLDAAVTVGTMATLSQHAVVYMDTHSGVNQYGEGVISTGEVFDTDHSLDPLVKEGSLMSVSVAGSSQLYYGVLSQYIRLHEGSFPAGALVILNGCGMLRASLFWQALQQRGVQTLVSWDNEVLSDDAWAASSVFFNALASGATVDAGVQAVMASGHGYSTPSGQATARYGYLGNGALTLRALIPATPTPVPSPSPSPRPTPTSTPTTVPVPHVSLLPAVRPGAHQTVRVTGMQPGAQIAVAVIYPDGESHSWHTAANASGAAQVRYVQPGGTITRASRTARVRVVSGPTLMQAHYAVGFGTLDVTVTPGTASSISQVTLWVHTESAGALQVHFAGAAIRPVAIGVRRAGWVPIHAVGPRMPAGDVRQITVEVTLRTAAHAYRAGTSFILLS